MKTFSTVNEVIAHRFIGNHASDCEAFNAINRQVEGDEWSVADKAEALRIMSDKGMGCGRDEHINDEDIVKDYLAST